MPIGSNPRFSAALGGYSESEVASALGMALQLVSAEIESQTKQAH